MTRTVSNPSPLLYFFFLMIRRPPRSTLFPTRRSSDLPAELHARRLRQVRLQRDRFPEQVRGDDVRLDRKSTRLNSSHSQISYAVFCLKKKKISSTGDVWTDEPTQPAVVASSSVRISPV